MTPRLHQNDASNIEICDIMPRSWYIAFIRRRAPRYYRPLLFLLRYLSYDTVQALARKLDTECHRRIQK